MLKGAIIGLVVSLLLVISCYYLLGAGADMCNPGYGFLLSPLILISAAIGALVLQKNKSVIIATAAKIVLVIIAMALLIYFYLFFL